jgi:hypothetical protein
MMSKNTNVAGQVIRGRVAPSVAARSTTVVIPTAEPTANDNMYANITESKSRITNRGAVKAKATTAVAVMMSRILSAFALACGGGAQECTMRQPRQMRISQKGHWTATATNGKYAATDNKSFVPITGIETAIPVAHAKNQRSAVPIATSALLG